jgi:hypothetical protein
LAGLVVGVVGPVVVGPVVVGSMSELFVFADLDHKLP